MQKSGADQITATVGNVLAASIVIGILVPPLFVVAGVVVVVCIFWILMAEAGKKP